MNTRKKLLGTMVQTIVYLLIFPIILAPLNVAFSGSLLTYGATASSGNGFSLSVRSGRVNLGEDLPTINNGALSSTLAIAGNGSLSSPSSSSGTFTRNYANNLLPGRFKTFQEKYLATLRTRIQGEANVRGGTVSRYTFKEYNSNLTISSTMSSQLGINPRNYYSFLVNGNLTINANTLCNIKGVFFVTGNLQINASLTNEQSFDGCAFFVDGNTTISVNNNADRDDVGYTQVDAFILSNGSINISGNSSANFRLRGSLIADSIQYSPNMIVVYDARYKFIFRDLNAVNSYSLREVF